jgi:hypothetical protein
MARIRILSSSSRDITILILCVVSFLILVSAIHPRKPPFVELTGEGELRSHTQSTGDAAFTLSPGAFRSFKFVVPADHDNASLKGQYSVTEQYHDGIEAFVLNEGDYKSWQHGYTTYRNYDSGNVWHRTVAVPLPVDAGTYYVIFNNRLPASASKSVRTNMSLVYSSRWWPGMP